MSKPDIISKTTVSGIAVDPRTLERVIPESRRPDGSIRKEIKIRPGFTPQEDVQRFRGTKQQQSDKTVLPKGHIIGWVPPSSATQTKTSTAGMSKSAKKNAKRKEKRAEKTVEKIKENWDDEDEDEDEAPSGEGKQKESDAAEKEDVDKKQKESNDADSLAEKLQKLDVR